MSLAKAGNPLLSTSVDKVENVRVLIGRLAKDEGEM